MLASRIAVAAVALPLLIATILIGGSAFATVVIVCLMIGAWEITALRITPGPNSLWISLATGSIPLAVSTDIKEVNILPLILLIPIAVTALQIGKDYDPVNNMIWLLVTMFYLGVLGSHFILLREHESGVEWVALALSTIILVDTSAYAFGKLFGGKLFAEKMAPSISPGKTWEGSIGGFAIGFITVLIANKITGLHITPGHQIVLGLLLPTTAILGDLLESKMKRIWNAKDMGHLLGGHGGIVDRIDSWLITIPVLYWYLQIFIR